MGADTLDDLFSKAPPAAIVGGFGPFNYFNDMDAALIDYARRHGYIRISDDWSVGRVYGYLNGQVWLRPSTR